MKNVPYRSIVGSLMYLMVGSRPDLATAVGTLSQYAVDPCPTYWHALKRVFRYLQATPTHGLRFSGSGCGELEGFWMPTDKVTSNQDEALVDTFLY